ncbi:MAG: 4Fe-4S binding protein, partial [Lachnospiraceae bacterium]|nr:4Fe-4S binding protein [Lachnospiraceae bacterium]
MINIIDKQMCCGCTACAGACPKNCIEMKEDTEGFLYPSVDKDKCIDCGACERVCPILNHKNREPYEQKGYIVQHKNPTVLRESTAGGAFT